MLDLQRFKVLTFDCYGTLINWEAGILNSLRPVLAAHAIELSDAEILKIYSELEPEAQESPFRRYRDVLEAVVAGFGERLGFAPSTEERSCLHASLPEWPPFADTIEALAALSSRYRLAVISNVDDDLFASTSQRLGVRFDWVITAQQVGAYKPSPVIFETALQRIGVPRERILHVAESLFHDIAPARALGLATVWVNRSQGKAAATRRSDVTPHLELPDLRTLAKLAM